MGRWHRGNDNEPHPEHPDRPPLGRVANSAVDNAGGELYTLYRVRWDSGRERIVAKLAGLYTGDRAITHPFRGERAREYPPYTMISDLLDLVTGEELEISSRDRDVEATRISVKDLPPALNDAWPRDAKGKPVRAGFHDDGDVMGKDVLRRLAGSVDARPEQETLFG